nr:MAG TPA: hypothetical protein [Caudoviricetes sp.]
MAPHWEPYLSYYHHSSPKHNRHRFHLLLQLIPSILEVFYLDILS